VLTELGSAETVQGRCVAPPPNVYQHQAQPFRPEDPTKPGVRKISAALLINTTYIIPSALTFPPQQREIFREAVLAADNSSWLGTLPTELIDMVSGGNGTDD